MIDDVFEALRESEQRYRTLFEQAPVGVFLYDRNLRIGDCNARFAQILKTTEANLIGLEMRTLKDRTILPAIERVLTGEASYYAGPYDTTFSSARIWISMHFSPLRDKAGTVVGGMGVVEDITERMRAQEALRQSEARFRELIERSPDLIGVARAGVVVYANDAFVRFFGYERADEIVGQPVTELFHREDASLAARWTREEAVGEAGTPIDEYRVRRRDGSAAHAEMTSLRVDYDGAPAVMVIGRDVSDRKLMQARLLQADRMVSIGTLAAGVAHEINNPLAYLMANLEIVATRKVPELAAKIVELERALATARGEPAPSADVSERFQRLVQMIEVAREGAERVRHTVRDLKTFSRPDDERRTPVDVRRVLDASINIAWNEIRHRAQLVREYGDVPPVLANESRLGQVFLNLLVNAAQALQVGSVTSNTIRVRTIHRDAPERVIVEIRDTGPGIPSENLARIFDPFFTTKAVGVGTGLGLWICQGIIASLGGSIVVESSPERETVFRVELPASGAVSRPVPERPPSSRPSIARRGRVLVIDDEVALAQVVAAALSNEHDVVVAGSGREALGILAHDDRFDVILCDLMMPDVTGMDVYARLRDESPAAARNMIFVTGGAFTPRARDFLDAVDNVHLEKPFDMLHLRQLLRDRVTRP